RFDRIPALGQLFAADYARVAAAQLWLAYHEQHLDDVIDRAQHAPDAAAPHFWAGLAWLAKGRAETKSDAQLGLLTRAAEERRRASPRCRGAPDPAATAPCSPWASSPQRPCRWR